MNDGRSIGFSASPLSSPPVVRAVVVPAMAAVAIATWLLFAPVPILGTGTHDTFPVPSASPGFVSPNLRQSHVEPGTTYLESPPGERGMVEFRVAPAKQRMDWVTLAINAANSRELTVECVSNSGRTTTFSLERGRLVWTTLDLGPIARGARELRIRVRLVASEEASTVLYGLRATIHVWRGITARRTAVALVSAAMVLLAWAASAWLFARAARLAVRAVWAAEAPALAPLIVLGFAPWLASSTGGSFLTTLAFGAGLAAVLARTLCRILRLDAAPEPRRAGIVLMTELWLVATLIFGKPIVNGDGVQYYAYARTTVFDGNLSIRDEYEQGLSRFGSPGPLLGTTSRGFQYAFAPPGVAVLWVPVLALTRLVGRAANAIGVPAVMDGYAVRDMFAVSLVSWCAALAGLFACHHVLVRRFRPSSTQLAMLVIAFGSPLLGSAFEMPTSAHSIDFAFASLLVAAVISARERHTRDYWFLIGACCGFLLAIRHQNALLALFAIAPLITFSKTMLELTGLGAALIVGGIVGYAPQVAINLALFGSPFVFHRIYVPGVLFPPAVWRDLFSWQHGLFSWTPLMLVGAAGLLAAACRGRHARWARLMAMCFAAQVALIGLIPDNVSIRFGQRYLINCLPFLAFGCAWVSDRIAHAGRFAVFGATCLLAIVWNIGLYSLFTATVGGIDKTGQSMTWRELAIKEAIYAPQLWTSHLAGASINGRSFPILTSIVNAPRVDRTVVLAACMIGGCLTAFAAIAWLGVAADRRSTQRTPLEQRALAIVVWALLLLIVVVSIVWLSMATPPVTS
jgi:hypothetical protein